MSSDYSASSSPPPDAVVLHETPYLCVMKLPTQHWLYTNWRGILNKTQVLEGSALVLQAVQEHGFRHLLNDNREVVSLDVDKEDWLAMDVLNQLYKAGLIYLAWIYAPTHVPVGRQRADEVLGQYEMPLLLTFEEYEMAAAWLAHIR